MLSCLFLALLGTMSQAHGQGGGVPVIRNFSPASGPVGTEVTIDGDHLAGATAVQFNNVTAVFHEGFSGNNLLAVVPGGASSGPITVVTPSGVATSTNSFTLTAALPPAVTGFIPESGAVGASVLITGSNFAGVSAVQFNGVNATYALFANTLTAYVPAGASTGPITVVATGGSASSKNAFVVKAADALAITDVLPSSGRPGERVTIAGQNLQAVTGVTFNGVAAAFSLFGTSILTTVPPDASSGLITVTSATTSASSPVAFTVINPLSPEVFGFSPPSGVVGSTIKITGTNFVGVTAVSFGGVSAGFIALSPTEVRASVPPGAMTGEIRVSTGLGTGVSSEIFRIPALLQSFTPSQGLPGTSVTLLGSNFTEVIAVLFGGVSAKFTVVSPTEIQAVVPDGAASGSITIATPAGFADTQTAFLLPPTVGKIDPPSGPPLTEVTITGANLLGVTAVLFGAAEATFVSKSVTTLIATVPASASTGRVTVVTPAGLAVSAENFYVGEISDIEVSLTASADSVSVGDLLDYTVTVTNGGPLPATGAVLTDRLPPSAKIMSSPTGAPCVVDNNVITCNLGDLAVGATVAIHVSVSVLDGPSHSMNTALC